MKILFISRAYPPVIGGIENQNYELSVWLGKVAEVKTIANTLGRKFLPVFLPYATIRAIFLMRKYDVLLLGDGVLSVVGWKIKLFHEKPAISVVHGLDINYGSASLGVWYERILIFLYQKLWVGIFFKKIDKFIAVGNETVRVAMERGIPKEKVVFIPNGIDPEKFCRPTDRNKLKDLLDIDIEGKRFVLTSGRLARRKGVAWFVENVMPKLPENVFYVVAGDGPDRENIRATITKNDLSKRVLMLGRVSDEVRDALFNACDVFVQPNIKIPGDMEGFGLSVIEAASCKIPVIASALEGLKDAIKDGENGFLVESGDADGYVEKIGEFLADEDYRKEFGERARWFVIKNNSWENIVRRYLEEISALVKQLNS